MKHVLALASLGAVMLSQTACSPPKPPLAELPPPVVSVAKPITDRMETDTLEFLATTAAAKKIEVRSRVTGYLKEIKFTPGDIVTKNETELFVIDRRPFEAALKKAEGDLKIAVAQEKFSEKELARAIAANNATPGATSVAERDKAAAQVDVWKAQIEAAEGARDQAKINLDFTIIKADETGRVGRNLITEGNLVTADQTILTTIVSTKEVYAFFDVDQPAMVEYRRRNPLAADGSEPPPKKVLFWLDSDHVKQSEAYIGEVDFTNVELNPNTGALQIRAVFTRSDLKKGQPPLDSGLTGRLQVAVSEPFKPILIPDVAIGTDQQQKYVYIVTPDNKVEYRKVTLGRLYADNLRQITSGLDGSELVVINGLQRIRPGVKVEPELVDPVTERPIGSPAAKTK